LECGTLRLAPEHGQGTGFWADIEAYAATGAAAATVCNGVVALTIQKVTLEKDARRASGNTKTASLAQMNRDLHITTIRIAHDPSVAFAHQPLEQKRLGQSTAIMEAIPVP
jgi:hypothetical protein